MKCSGTRRQQTTSAENAEGAGNCGRAVTSCHWGPRAMAIFVPLPLAVWNTPSKFRDLMSPRRLGRAKHAICRSDPIAETSSRSRSRHGSCDDEPNTEWLPIFSPDNLHFRISCKLKVVQLLQEEADTEHINRLLSMGTLKVARERRLRTCCERTPSMESAR